MIKIDPSWIPILHLDMYNKIIKTNNIIASKSKLLLPWGAKFKNYSFKKSS